MMICLPYVTVVTDEPFWVPKTIFFEHFDQNDFLCRESVDVTSSYLASWFYTPDDGKRRFELPAVHFVSGKTQFINGRHRTAVLLPYLDNLPIAFSFSSYGIPDDSLRRLINPMGLIPLNLGEQINLPDLPIVSSIP
jgi:hypothetical protein